jgi:hypothetical protein
LLHERSIALTVVDDALVEFLHALHKQHFEAPHGRFSREQVNADWPRVAGYDLYYMSQSFKRQPYDVYGPHATPYEKARQCEDELIRSVRFIRIGDEQAITLSNDFFESAEYLSQMMETIMPEWMNGELKIER